MFPAYVAFQLIPLPLFFLHIIDPVRASLASAVNATTPGSPLSSITLFPGKTWTSLARAAACALVFLMLRGYSRRRKETPWAAGLALVAIASLEAALGLLQSSAGSAQPSGTLFERNLFSGLLAAVLPFALMYAIAILSRGRERGLLGSGSALKACALFGLALLMFLGILVSGSKMGFAATLGSLFVAGGLWLAKSVEGKKRWAILAVFGILVVSLFIFLPTESLSHAYTTSVSDPTAEGRIPVSKDTLHFFADYPLLGAGFGAFDPGFVRYQTAMLQVGWNFAHDDIVQFLAELGILGFLIAAVLACAAFASAAKAAFSAGAPQRCLGAACAGSMAAILIHSLAHIGMYIASNALVYSWIAGLSISLPAARNSGGPGPSTFTISAQRGAAALFAVFSVLYASAWIVFDHSFKNAPQAEPTFCKFGVCNTEEIPPEIAKNGGDPTLVPLADLQEFLRRDPAGPNHWCDLGEYMQKAGRAAEARACFTEAVELAPRKPFILFRAARFHFSAGEDSQALDLSARALEGDPDYGEPAFEDYEQRKISLEQVMNRGLPSAPGAWQAYLRWLMGKGRAADALVVWSRMLPRPGYIDQPLTKDYINFLLSKKEVADAAQAWGDFARTQPGMTANFPDPEHVFNGGFETDPVPEAAFDWWMNPTAGVEKSFDTETTHSGKRSLKLDFDRTQNLTGFGVAQSLYLKPGGYRFRAWVKTKDLSTEQGISFIVTDEKGQLYFETEPLLGSTDWKLIERRFEVPAAKGLARISLVRKEEWKFDNKVAGTLWIDGVSIRPEGR